MTVLALQSLSRAKASKAINPFPFFCTLFSPNFVTEDSHGHFKL